MADSLVAPNRAARAAARSASVKALAPALSDAPAESLPFSSTSSLESAEEDLLAVIVDDGLVGVVASGAFSAGFVLCVYNKRMGKSFQITQIRFKEAAQETFFSRIPDS